VQDWKQDYPWLQLAFKHIGPAGRGASEEWRVRIEDLLETTLDFKARPDGSATVWCGLSGYDFRHDPTPKELLEGLADAYRREAERLGLHPGFVIVATRDGPVEVSPSAKDELLAEMRLRGSDEAVVRAFAGAGASSLISLDRAGKIVVFDALWDLADRTGGDDQMDAQLALLRDRLRDEIAEGPSATATDAPNA
jgi:hypothetical protein